MLVAEIVAKWWFLFLLDVWIICASVYLIILLWRIHEQKKRRMIHSGYNEKKL